MAARQRLNGQMHERAWDGKDQGQHPKVAGPPPCERVDFHAGFRVDGRAEPHYSVTCVQAAAGKVS